MKENKYKRILFVVAQVMSLLLFQFSETHEIPLFFEVSAKTGQGVRQVCRTALFI